MMTFTTQTLDDLRNIPQVNECCPKCMDNLYVYTPRTSPSYKWHRKVLTQVQMGKRRLASPPVSYDTSDY